jgi:hypothetical protein
LDDQSFGPYTVSCLSREMTRRQPISPPTSSLPVKVNRSQTSNIRRLPLDFGEDSPRGKKPRAIAPQGLDRKALILDLSTRPLFPLDSLRADELRKQTPSSGLHFVTRTRAEHNHAALSHPQFEHQNTVSHQFELNETWDNLNCYEH